MNTNPIIKTKKKGNYNKINPIAKQNMAEFGGVLGPLYFFNSCAGLDFRVSYLQSYGDYNFVDLSMVKYNKQGTKYEINNMGTINNPGYLSFKIGFEVNLCQECFEFSKSTSTDIGNAKSSATPPTPFIIPGGSGCSTR